MHDCENNSHFELSKIDKNSSEARTLNLEMLKIIQLTSQELVRLKGNDDFYDNTENAEKFINIISGDCEISIRLIDYFVTKYSKYNKCSYKIFENNKDVCFNVHFDYKSQLKHYQKTHFDPFSRGDRIPFFMNDTCIITTIGQLNFFRWFISKKIFDYLLEKKNDVYNDMNKKNRNIKKSIKKPTKIIEKKQIETFKKPIIIQNKIKDINKSASKILVSFI
jgi:hypothetical protein